MTTPNETLASKSALFALLHKHGGIETYPGATFINENLSWASNEKESKYRGYEVLPKGEGVIDIISCAQFPWEAHKVTDGPGNLTCSGAAFQGLHANI
jgi:hypothetical protein